MGKPPPRVSLSLNTCETYFKTSSEFHDRIRQSFASSNILELEYERLLPEPHLCLEWVWKFLELSVRPVSGRANFRPRKRDRYTRP